MGASDLATLTYRYETCATFSAWEDTPASDQDFSEAVEGANQIRFSDAGVLAFKDTILITLTPQNTYHLSNVERDVMHRALRRGSTFFMKGRLKT